MIDIKLLQTKLDDARREVGNLIVIGMHQDLAPEKAAAVRQLERSARTEVVLRIRALAYAMMHQRES